MKIKVINGHQKDKGYIINDESVEMNTPALAESEVLLVGQDMNNKKIVGAEYPKENLKDLLPKYSLYVPNIEIDDQLSPEEKETTIANFKSTLFDWCKAIMSGLQLIQVEPAISFSMLSLVKMLGVDDFDAFIDDTRIRFYPENDYTREEIENIVYAAIVKMNKKIFELSSYIANNTVTHDMIQALADMPDSLDVPEIGAANIMLQPEDVNYDFLDSMLEYSSSVTNSLIDYRDERIKRIESNVDSLHKFDEIRSWAKVRAAFYDVCEKEWTSADEILVDDHKIDFITELDESHPGKIIYHIRGICPNEYVLKFKKKGYLTASFKMKTKISTQFSAVNELDMGNINLIRKDAEMKLILSWGSMPDDLDTHIYSFNAAGEMQEHCFFNNKQSDLSKISINVDVVKKYGPETTCIAAPKKDLYYLFTVHNYTYHFFNDEQYAHMNAEDKTNVEVRSYSLKFNLSPSYDYESHWWDALVLHNDHIYVIDKPNEKRPDTWGYSLTENECKSIIVSLAKCSRVYEVSQFRPIGMRFFI